MTTWVLLIYTLYTAVVVPGWYASKEDCDRAGITATDANGKQVNTHYYVCTVGPIKNDASR